MQSSYYRVLVRKSGRVVEATPSPRSRKAAIEFAEAIAAREPDAEILAEIVTTRVERFKTIKPAPEPKGESNA